MKFIEWPLGQRKQLDKVSNLSILNNGFRFIEKIDILNQSYRKYGREVMALFFKPKAIAYGVLK